MHLLGRWWLQLLALAAFPVVIALGSYQAASLVPGAVAVAAWQSFVSWLFLACAMAVAALAWRARARAWPAAPPAPHRP